MSLKVNTAWNLAGGLLPLMAAAAFIPYVLNQLGNEAFGVLTLIWALIGYFSLFDFGVGRALTYELSKLRGVNSNIEISAALKAGLLITAATGVVGCLVMLALASSLAKNWMGISAAWQSDAKAAFQIAAVGVIFTTLTSGLRGALEGMERFAASNLNKIFLGLSIFSLPALSVYLHGPNLLKIALYLVAARLVVLIWGVLQVWPYLLYSTSSFDLKRIKSLLTFGGWFTISGIVGPLMIYGDRFFVAAVVGTSQLTIYAIPQEGLQRLLIISTALCGALLPHLASMPSLELEDSYRRNYRHVVTIMAGVCLLSAALAYPVLAVWLSPEFAQQALPIVLILSIGIWLNSISMVPLTLLHAVGNSKLTALFHLAELVIYVIALYLLTTYLGLIGAPMAWVGRVMIDLILLHGAAERHLIQKRVGKK